MNFLFTPGHEKLLNACYPPSLLTSGPDYSPNSQELSRLTYYACVLLAFPRESQYEYRQISSNHPEKLAKIGSELEKRVRTESRKARSGNIKMRA